LNVFTPSLSHRFLTASRTYSTDSLVPLSQIIRASDLAFCSLNFRYDPSTSAASRKFLLAVTAMHVASRREHFLADNCG